MKNGLFLVMMTCMSINAFASADTYNSVCTSASGYCLSTAGVSDPSRNTTLGTEYATPGSRYLLSTPNSVRIDISNTNGQVTLEDETTKARITLGSTKLPSSSASSTIEELKLAAGVSFKSVNTRTGTQITCSENAMGLSEKHLMPVAEFTSVAQSGSVQIKFVSIMQTGDLQGHLSFCNPHSPPSYRWQ